VKAAERGQPAPLSDLEPATRAALATIRAALDAQIRDWDRYTRLAIEFHRRNAHAWANARVGEDLTDQIDPEFRITDTLSTVDSPH